MRPELVGAVHGDERGDRHLALLHQPLHGPGHVLDRHIRVHAVLIKQVYGLDPESPERTLDYSLDVLPLTVQSTPVCFTLRGRLEAEFSRYHQLPAVS